ncbi:MAG TPA: serine hydrolase domain-containing protein [Actinomycetota bacterium]|nr:serine hydrolase domain-containing protein [Actinomycetota bacterium]
MALAEAFERIGAFLEDRLPLMHAAGTALAVTDRDEILGVVVRGFADAASGTPVRPETRFQIGSISKSFTAIVTLQAAEEGLLDLHAPIDRLVPWIEVPQPFGAITPHHLLTHTSGLPIGTEDAPGALAAAWNLRHVRPGFGPGERFWYSNDGYKLVGLVLERALGRPFGDLVRERILAPLEMGATSPVITNRDRADLATGYATLHDGRPPHRHQPLVPAPWAVSGSADGSIVSNVLDMTAYARMLLAAGAPLLSPSGFEALTAPRIQDTGAAGFAYGYGLYVGEQDGRRRIYHTGGMIGYTALLMLDPDDGLGLVMLVNGQGERKPAGRFALRTVRAALTGEPLPPVVHLDPVRTPHAAGYVGRYSDGRRSFEVAARGDRLVLRRNGTETILEPRLEDEVPTQDLFVAPDPELERSWLWFGRNAEGEVVEAVHGPDRMPREGVTRPEPPPVPERWPGFTGLYRSNDPWIPCFRVVLRGGELWMLLGDDDEPELPLVPIGDEDFRVGREPWRPSRVAFDRIVEGRAIRAVHDGGSWYRSFED